MPLIFAENDATESGIEYADQTGVSYQFPLQYRNTIQPGERFIYYRGRKKYGGGRQPQVYFGAGIVGDVSAEAGDSSRLRCEVLDYKAFQIPVPFKDSNSLYFESGGSRRGYFQRGVRRVSEQEFERILTSAEAELVPGANLIPTENAGSGYASAELMKAVERYAVEAVLKMLKLRYPNSEVIEQARNNPGFDILVTRDDGNYYVEVKGASGRRPFFIITEGEVKFSEKQAARYLLAVVHHINLKARSHEVFEHHGAVNKEVFSKEPLQWRCVPFSS